MDWFQKISNPDVIVFKLASWMLHRGLHGNEGIPVLIDELLEGKIALTLPHASVN